jgi:hypothetical protein
MRGMWVGRGKILTVGHGVPELDFEVEIRSIYCTNGGVSVHVSQEHVTRFGYDYALIDVGMLNSAIPLDFRRFVARNSDTIAHMLPAEGYVVNSELFDGERTTYFQDCSINAGRAVRYTVNGREIMNYDCMRYKLDTFNGDCGALVMRRTSTGGVEIVGMHVARDADGYGRAQMLTKELVEELVSAEVLAPTVDGPSGIADNGCAQVGVLQDGMYARVNTRSTIHKSPYFEAFGPHTMEPAPLSGKDENGVTVLQKALSKFRGWNLVDVDLDLVEESLCGLRTYYSVMKDTEPLSWFNSVNGDERCPPLPIHTSAGLMPGMKNKKSYWLEESVREDGRKVFSPTEELMELLNEREANAMVGERTLALFAVNLKNEKRDIARVRALKTRAFLAARLDFVLAVRRYFLKMCCYIEDRHGRGPIKCGINPHGPAWMRLRKSLSQEGGTMWCGDFSRFDQSIPEIVMRAAARFLADTAGGGIVRDILLEEVINAHFAVGQRVYATLGMNPSGNPLTTILNSVVQYIVLYSAIKRICIRHSIEFDMLDCVFALYGDDNVVWVPVPDFPLGELAGTIRDMFGMEYTAADKSDNIEPCSIDDVTFLGRKFVSRPRHVDAPLDLDRIKEIMYWYQGGMDTRLNVLASQAQSFMVELSHHGREVYEQYVKELRDHPFTDNIDDSVVWRQYHELLDARWKGLVSVDYL